MGFKSGFFGDRRVRKDWQGKRVGGWLGVCDWRSGVCAAEGGYPGPAETGLGTGPYWGHEVRRSAGQPMRS